MSDKKGYDPSLLRQMGVLEGIKRGLQKSMSKDVSVSGIMLTTTVGENKRIVVSAEIFGVWVDIIDEPYDVDSVISHIVEPLGMGIRRTRGKSI